MVINHNDAIFCYKCGVKLPMEIDLRPISEWIKERTKVWKILLNINRLIWLSAVIWMIGIFIDVATSDATMYEYREGWPWLAAAIVVFMIIILRIKSWIRSLYTIETKADFVNNHDILNEYQIFCKSSKFGLFHNMNKVIIEANYQYLGWLENNKVLLSVDDKGVHYIDINENR